MQVVLILGIAFALASVMFALQNNVPVTVTFLVWRFDSSLAVVLLVALGLGALIAGLVSSPAMIRGSWTGSRLRRQVADLEKDGSDKQRRIGELEAEVASLTPAPAQAAEQTRPYVGLRTLIAGSRDDRIKNDGGTT